LGSNAIDRYRGTALVIICLCLNLSLSIGLADASTTDLEGHHDVMAAAESPRKPYSPVTFQTVSKGYRSGAREPQQIVLRNQAEWSELWRKHSNELYSTPPTVLFDQEIVVAVFLGEKNTGGYDITIVRAERNDDELVIHYQEKTPAPGSMLIQAFMQPFHIVRINKSDLSAKVSFRRES